MELLEKKANLIEKINEGRILYTNTNNEYKEKKCRLLLETDFVEVLNKSRPTIDEKNAYVDLNTLELKKTKELIYDNIKYLEMQLDLINDEISLKE